ncbi:LiaF transmembrane domain-containing protein [Gemella cuniculi]|uniref:LiaF transmembrane domain-containing protein n=1 Tax=Gemella cuniculi TaxID=150240 RepID=UPI000421F6FF|nr:LiaF domain-containing protein [Gemella cuniculi]
MRRINFVGVFFIILAIFTTFNELNYFPTGTVFLSLSTIVLGYFIVRGLMNFDSFGVVLPSVLLLIIYNKHFHFLNISTGKIIWIAILFSIGFSILIPKKIKYKHHKKNKFRNYTKKNDTKDYSNILFGENVRYVNINETDYFNVTTTFGESNIYFNKPSTYAIKDIQINITATFGEVKLFIPKEWRVKNEISTIFGEVSIPIFSDNTNNDVKIFLTGNLTFGKVTIIHI